MRVLFNREVVFARNVDYTHKWSPGSDIRNISEFMSANVNVANPLWYNYDRNYDAELKWLGSCLVRIVQLMDLATQEVVYASQDLQVWTVIHQSNSSILIL